MSRIVDLNLRKNEKKSDQQLFSKVEIFKKNVIVRPIFHGLCLIGYKSIIRQKLFYQLC